MRTTKQEYDHNYYLAHRQKILEHVKEQYRKNPGPVRKRTSEWYNNNRERARFNGLRGWLRSEYGLTLEEYDKLVQAQDGKCAICQRKPTKERLAIDHCHETKRIRGLLCRKCNSGIGMLSDSAEFVARALAYLEKGAKDGQATRKL